MKLRILSPAPYKAKSESLPRLRAVQRFPLRVLVLIGGLVAALALILLASRISSAITDQSTLQGADDPPLLLSGQTANSSAVNAVSRLYHLRADAARVGWTFETHNRAAEFYVALGDPQTAAAHWEAALAERPDDPATLRQLAAYALTAERWDTAVDRLEAYIPYAPDDAWANTWLGVLYAPYNSTVAISALEKALNADSLPSGFDAETLTALRDILAALPSGDLSGPLQVGVVLIDHELWSLAERAFRVAVAVGEGEAEALAYQGLARTMQGKSGAAQIKRALALGADDAKVLYVAALYAQALNDGTGTLDALMTAATLHPDDPAFSALIGQAFLINGLYSEADVWLRYAVEQSGNDPNYVTMLEAFRLDYAPRLDAVEQLLAPSPTPIPAIRSAPR